MANGWQLFLAMCINTQIYQNPGLIFEADAYLETGKWGIHGDTNICTQYTCIHLHTYTLQARARTHTHTHTHTHKHTHKQIQHTHTHTCTQYRCKQQTCVMDRNPYTQSHDIFP